MFDVPRRGGWSCPRMMNCDNHVRMSSSRLNVVLIHLYVLKCCTDAINCIPRVREAVIYSSFLFSFLARDSQKDLVCYRGHKVGCKQLRAAVTISASVANLRTTNVQCSLHVSKKKTCISQSCLKPDPTYGTSRSPRENGCLGVAIKSLPTCQLFCHCQTRPLAPE